MATVTSNVRRVLGAGIGQLAKMASRNYIAGPGLDDTQRVCNILLERGYWVTQGYWNSEGEEPHEILRMYQAAIKNLGEMAGNHYLSVKIPALGYDGGFFDEILCQSREHSVPLHFDALAPEHAAKTLLFVQQYSQSQLHDIGYTLPGRWHRSIHDADLVSELGLNARVVKGQWNDPQASDLDPRAGFMRIIERLAGKSRCVRVATHDVTLARDALSRLQATGTYCELELLYGLPIGPIVSLASKMAVPVRVYVAFGHAYLPYALSDLRKKPQMLIPLAKEAFKRDYLSSIPDCRSNED